MEAFYQRTEGGSERTIESAGATAQQQESVPAAKPAPRVQSTTLPSEALPGAAYDAQPRQETAAQERPRAVMTKVNKNPERAARVTAAKTTSACNARLRGTALCVRARAPAR